MSANEQHPVYIFGFKDQFRVFMFQINRLKGKGDSKPKLDSPKQKTLEKTTTGSEELLQWQAQNNEKIAKMIKKAKENYNGLLVPEIDHKSAKFGYRIFRELEEEYDIEFLENLVSLGIFDKVINNKFLVCPEHQSSFLLSVRINCTKCNSINVTKLHLMEHRACGHISEKKYFEKTDGELKCPSCKKQIKNQEKELRLPASWYLCNDCADKFDEAKISLHCNEFDHDFTANQASSAALYNYVLSDSTENSQLDHGKLKEAINKILSKYGYSVNESHVVKGKSGIDHTVDIAGIDGTGQSVFIFVNSSAENSSEIDSRLIQILDTSPKIAILVGFSSISEKTKSIASKYNLSIISSQNIDEITAEIQKIVSAKIKKTDGGKET